LEIESIVTLAVGFLAGIAGSIWNYFRRKAREKKILLGIIEELKVIDDTLSKVRRDHPLFATFDSQLLPLVFWTYRGIGWKLAMVVSQETLKALHETYRMITMIKPIEDEKDRVGSLTTVPATIKQVEETRKQIANLIPLLKKELN